MLFWPIFALFGVPGPGRYRICTDRSFFFMFLMRKPMRNCLMIRSKQLSTTTAAGPRGLGASWKDP